MRFILLLLLALAVSIALIVFPNIADQALRVEAFGWIFETRQGAFIVALLALLLLLWLLRSFISMLFAGPGMAWRSLRLGSRKRRENKLRDALAQWLDGRGNVNARALKRCRGVLPDWAIDMLQTMIVPAAELPLPAEDQDPLITALAARVATDPQAQNPADTATRKAHLEAWLYAHPGAPLAASRLVDIAEEEGDLLEFINRLEGDWKQGRRSADVVKPRLVRACLKLAGQSPEQSMAFLRKAYRLLPDDPKVLLAYGNGLLDSGDVKTVQRLWNGYLEQHSNDRIARAFLKIQRDDPIRVYRKLERKTASALNPAQRWLRAELAHAAKLDGLAFEQMQALADDCGSAAAWDSLGHWHEELGDFEKAAGCYRQALEKHAVR